MSQPASTPHPVSAPDLDSDRAPGPAPAQDLAHLERSPAVAFRRPTAQQPIRLPADAAASAALVLRYVQTGEASAVDRSEALEAMAGRVAKLTDPGLNSAAMLAELSGHAAVLDALFQRWTCAAVQAEKPEHQATFAKLALNTQAAHLRTLSAITTLSQQQGGGRGRGDGGDGGADFEAAD